MNHFEVFGLAPTVDLDVKALEQRLRERSLQYHPDRVPQGDAKQRLTALEMTTAINDAFKVLRDPVKRAVYLLKLKGLDLDNAAASNATMPLTFLQEVIEHREKLEALKARNDLTGVQRMAIEMAKEKEASLAAAQAALRNESLTEAAHHLGRIRYFARFLEEVEAFEEASS
jgi:molecular chaperone HscB